MQVVIQDPRLTSVAARRVVLEEEVRQRDVEHRLTGSVRELEARRRRLDDVPGADGDPGLRAGAGTGGRHCQAREAVRGLDARRWQARRQSRDFHDVDGRGRACARFEIAPRAELGTELIGPDRQRLDDERMAGCRVDRRRTPELAVERERDRGRGSLVGLWRRADDGLEVDLLGIGDGLRGDERGRRGDRGVGHGRRRAARARGRLGIARGRGLVTQLRIHRPRVQLAAGSGAFRKRCREGSGIKHPTGMRLTSPRRDLGPRPALVRRDGRRTRGRALGRGGRGSRHQEDKECGRDRGQT